MVAFLLKGVALCDTCGKVITLEDVARTELGNSIFEVLEKLGWSRNGLELKCSECVKKGEVK